MSTIATILAPATAVFAKAKFQTVKFSPEILTGVGVAGVVTSGVLAARATLKLESVLDKGQDRLKEARYLAEKGAVPPNTVNVAKLAIALDIVKLYGPSVSLGLASLVCIVSAHGILKKRNAALAVAYTSLESAYKNYRERVREELGDEKERDLYFGLKDEIVKNEETGKDEKVTSIGDPSELSPYVRLFDETNPNWTKQADQNLFFLRAQQNYFNDKLRAHGHVFLNEVFDALGMDRTPAGAIVGWRISDEGDNFVDFNIYTPENRDFVQGQERSVWLDFNVDGVIYNKI